MQYGLDQTLQVLEIWWSSLSLLVDQEGGRASETAASIQQVPVDSRLVLNGIEALVELLAVQSRVACVAL